jgi:predicted aldo/keto reductase-like oxidoreductase
MLDEAGVAWDFVQIQMNYVDWERGNPTAEYMYNRLTEKNIPVIIMEPLLGGSLATMNYQAMALLKEREPQKSIASWAFRFVGSYDNVLTALSGMTYMEHLKDNLLSYCPLQPLTKAEQQYLEHDVAERIVGLENIPCNDCKYCMPCPYGVDIPAIFIHYNKCMNEGLLPHDRGDKEYQEQRRAYLIGQDRKVPKLRQADHCIGCNKCNKHCPQNINIPKELKRIDQFVEHLKQDTL